MYLLMSKLIFQSKHRHNGILNFEVPVRVSNLERHHNNNRVHRYRDEHVSIINWKLDQGIRGQHIIASSSTRFEGGAQREEACT